MEGEVRMIPCPRVYNLKICSCCCFCFDWMVEQGHIICNLGYWKIEKEENRKKYPYESNPYVWVISFQRCE